MKSHVVRLILFLAILAGMILPGGTAGAAPTGSETVTGWLTVTWGDRRDGGTSTRVALTSDSGESRLLQLDEALTAPLGGLLAIDRKRVTVEGNWVTAPEAEGGLSVFRATRLTREQRSESPQAAVSGPQPWVSVMCKFSDYADEPKSLSYFQNMYSSSYPGLDHYWREVSYNTANVAGSTAVGWYVLPQPRSYYVYNNSLDFNRAANDCTAVADPFVNFSGMVGINLMFNADLDGYAWGGANFMTLDGVSKVWSMTWEPPWGYSSITVMSHEMGHGFGLPHSSGNYGATYDNRWDVMSDTWSDCGNSSEATYGCLGQHTISYHKDILGWIPPAEKFLAPAGTSTITLEQLALPQSGNYKMAQIPVGGSSTRFYTVEVRRKTGYDVKLPGQAVIIHYVDTTRDRPARVIDIDNNGDTGDAGAMWIVGETFNDAPNGISVQIVSSSATAFTVTITTPGGVLPGAFNKTAPASGSTVGTSPTLSWGTSSGATSYEYCFDTNDNNACDDVWTSTTNKTVTLSGLAENVYYWQVRARNAYGTTDSNSGAWWNFTVGQVAPNSLEPGVPYPGTANNIHTRRPTFKWDSYPGATSYLIEVADAANCATFATKALRANTSSTSYTPTTDLKPNAVYCWRVRASVGASPSQFSQVRTFRTGNPPSVPKPGAPANNGLVTSTAQPSFNWGNSSLPSGTAFSHYEFQFDVTNTFASALTFTTAPGDINDSDLTSPTPGFPTLNRATTYFWRVRSWNTAGDFSGWSATYSFRVAYAPPSLLTPSNGAGVGGLRPTFTWTAVLGATSYRIQVSAYINFNIMLVNATVTGVNAYIPTINLTAHKTLYWRVQANGAYGPSAWSEVWSFITP